MSENPLPLEKENEVYSRKSWWGEVWGRLYLNKMAMAGLAILIILVLAAIFADAIAPFGYDDQNLNETFLRPSLSHLFGTDNFGRDIFSRILYGARISLTVGLFSVSISVVAGGLLGAVSAYYGHMTDNVIMRLVDVFLAIPGILLSISIASALGPGLMNMMIAVGIGSLPTYARVTRAAVLSIKEQEFIEAAVSVGASNFRVILRHILPNCLAPIIVQATLGVASAILVAASMSFIGLGLEPPTPEWGAMLSVGRPFIRDHWHIVTFPGIMIMFTIFALNVFGDGLRDALDPRLKR
ncbi:MAG: ABC transporter permease [Clostridiales bacterium]|jgi:peptide/nickel transport system permease protein|nr:ABC transporter permease [Clostridiales bacterium]